MPSLSSREEKKRKKLLGSVSQEGRSEKEKSILPTWALLQDITRCYHVKRQYIHLLLLQKVLFQLKKKKKKKEVVVSYFFSTCQITAI